MHLIYRFDNSLIILLTFSLEYFIEIFISTLAHHITKLLSYKIIVRLSMYCNFCETLTLVYPRTFIVLPAFDYTTTCKTLCMAAFNKNEIHAVLMLSHGSSLLVNRRWCFVLEMVYWITLLTFHRLNCINGNESPCSNVYRIVLKKSKSILHMKSNVLAFRKDREFHGISRKSGFFLNTYNLWKTSRGDECNYLDTILRIYVTGGQTYTEPWHIRH